MQPAAFADLVGDALAHVHDLSYLQRHALASRLVAESRGRVVGKLLQQALLDGIEALRPGRQVSPESHAWRSYQLLSLRYVEALDVPTAYSRLAISRREYYRDHSRAIQELALALEERLGSDEVVTDRGDPGVLERRSKLAVLSSAREPAGNLPVSLTSFVGRERELAEVKRLLFTRQLLTLTGSGGCGKTRLALQVASELLAESPGSFPDGVYLVELASLSDPVLVAQTVAASLGLREVTGEPILTTLLSRLRSRGILLLLDNCEHLLDACAQLANSLLTSCPRLRILATSREALRMAGEVAWRVPSLSSPSPKTLPEPPPGDSASWLAVLSQFDSVRLFVERAADAKPGFSLSSRNAAVVVQLCQRLDGIPLALELAATRVTGLSVEQIVARLDQRFRLLTVGSRTALPRQQTLRATVEWSYDLLAEPERALFRRLAVFAGGCTLEAVEAVCGSGPLGQIEPFEALELLLRLVDKSLVVAEADGEQARYRLPETIRQYAQERLEESGETRETRDRHRDWCLRLVEAAEPEPWLRPMPPEWLDRLDAEQHNVRAALGWANEHAADVGLRIAGRLWRYWVDRGNQAEGRRWLDAALARAPERTVHRAQALLALAQLVEPRFDADRAWPLAEEALALFREHRVMEGVSVSLACLGLAAQVKGDHERAWALLEESVAEARESGHRHTVAHALGNLAVLAYARADYGRARALYEENLAIGRELGNERLLSWTLRGLGAVALVEGEHERARALLEESLDLARRIGFRQGIVGALARLGDLERAQGRFGSARARLSEGLAIAQRAGSANVSEHLSLLGILAIEQGTIERGIRLIASATAGEGDRGSHLLWDPRSSRGAAIGRARTALGEEGFADTWAEGRAMTLEQAVEYALRDDEA